MESDPGPEQESHNSHLPPLSELLSQIQFNVHGLGAPYLGLQLRSLHYGVAESDQAIVGLGLYYAQKYLASSQVLAVESSSVPETVSEDDSAARAKWSWSNFVTIRDASLRLHRVEPYEVVDEDTLDRQFEEAVAEISQLKWTPLARYAKNPLLTDMEITRDAEQTLMGRNFQGRTMHLIAGIGFKPEQFIEAANQLVVLQEAPEVVQRHQVEFERFSEER